MYGTHANHSGWSDTVALNMLGMMKGEPETTDGLDLSTNSPFERLGIFLSCTRQLVWLSGSVAVTLRLPSLVPRSLGCQIAARKACYSNHRVLVAGGSATARSRQILLAYLGCSCM